MKMKNKEFFQHNTAVTSTLKENDAHIHVSFIEDSIEARGTFYPAKGDNGSPVTPEYIAQVMKHNRLIYGIQRDKINEAVRICNNEKEIVSDVVMARGEAPVKESAEHIRLNPALTQEFVNIKGKIIDYINTPPFVIVKKDQVLGRYEPYRPGKDGKNVHGETIPYKIAQPSSITGGENTRMAGRFLVSNINGQMLNTDGLVNVQPNLEINSPMSHKSGDINFPGDIYLEGPVSDGFKIYSGGSLTIKKIFEVSDAVTKGDLNAAGGIIGKGMTQIKIGGNLNTRFIENCRIACRKTVSVSASIINSSVFSLESIESVKGQIMGGELWAVNGIKAAGLGKLNGHCPKIHCGVDFAADQEKEKNNNILRILSARLSKVRQMLMNPEIDKIKKASLEELRASLTVNQKKASNAIAELMNKIIANEHAAVEISGEIVPGTLIEICQVALFVTEELKNVRIRLDIGKGKLITEQLQKKY
ncbi:MAG: FapA family protein [Treponema sp.]|jgi:uncharacterized protein (DUF342 family)|nr:FapA family protein [Treponema sp.]